ncbi:MAG: hypothetical protein HYY45_09715 [Deltaproteobacteria bacterium]|nr:hypothetical protein [Deltaproteobacteria bacterium]
MDNTKARGSQSRPVNYFSELIRLRDEYREDTKDASPVINGEAIPLENNAMGLIRWYLHPSMKKIPIRTQLVWVQEISPGSRSGKLKSQGGQISIVLEGRGYTIIDGVRTDWKQFDALFHPLLPEGTVIQHFNSDPKEWAKLLCSEPNFVDSMGVDKGSGFEILEDSPDYKP